jgi:acyl carrier protein
MESLEIKNKIKAYFKKVSDYTPKDEEDLFESGVLDSFGVAEFLTFLEEHLNAQVQLEDITEENFSTVDKITRLILS